MLSEEVMKLIGQSDEVVIMEVEKGAIKKHADAVGDRNPLYWDDEYAKKSRYGSIIAPPGFFGWPTSWTGPMPGFSGFRQKIMDAIAKEGYPRILDGGIEYDFFYPVYAGDTLASLTKLKDVYERDVKNGKMVLSISETTLTNQNGTVVAKIRQTIISR